MKSLRAELDAARTDAYKARADAARAAASASTAPATGRADTDSDADASRITAIAQTAREVYDAINDILSEIRNNVKLVQGELPGFQADPNALQAVRDAVDALVDNAETAKGALRGLRDLADQS